MSSISSSTISQDSDEQNSQNFHARFKRLNDSSEYSDCEFVVGAKKVSVKGHKLIFCLASDIFKAMFYGDLREDSVVHIPDLEPDGFEGMKYFIYTSSTDFKSVKHALSIYKAADKYLLRDLCILCVNYVSRFMQPWDVLEFYEECVALNFAEFIGICIKVIQNHTTDVVNSKKFMLIKSDTMDCILMSPALELRSELEVFACFERWAFAEARRREIREKEMATAFNNLKKHIRFLTMSCSDQFALNTARSPLLTQEEKLAIGYNLMNFGSVPYPEYLSPIKQERIFSPGVFTSEMLVKREFVISFETGRIADCSSCQYSYFNFLGQQWRLNLFYFNEDLCLSLEPLDTSTQELLVKLKSYFQITYGASVTEHYDPIEIEKDISLVFYELPEFPVTDSYTNGHFMVFDIAPLRLLRCSRQQNADIHIKAMLTIKASYGDLSSLGSSLKEHQHIRFKKSSVIVLD